MLLDGDEVCAVFAALLTLVPVLEWPTLEPLLILLPLVEMMPPGRCILLAARSKGEGRATTSLEMESDARRAAASCEGWGMRAPGGRGVATACGCAAGRCGPGEGAADPLLLQLPAAWPFDECDRRWACPG